MVTDQEGNYAVTHLDSDVTQPVDAEAAPALKVCLAYTDAATLQRARPHTPYAEVKGFEAMAALAKQGIPAVLLNSRTASARVIKLDTIPELKGMTLPFDPLGRATPWAAVAPPGSKLQVAEHTSDDDDKADSHAPTVAQARTTGSDRVAGVRDWLLTPFALAAVGIIQLAGLLIRVGFVAVRLLLLAEDLVVILVTTAFHLIAYVPAGVVLRKRIKTRLAGKEDPLAEPQAQPISWVDRLAHRLAPSYHVDPFQHSLRINTLRHPFARELRNRAAAMLYAEIRYPEWPASDLRHLDLLIALAEVALWQCPTADPLSPYANYILGDTLRARYRRTGKVRDLDRARDALQRALAALGATESRSRLASRKVLVDKPEVGRSLGEVLLDSYRRDGDNDELTRAIVELEIAVAHPRTRRIVTLLHTLSEAYSERYGRTGALADLDLAITALDHALDATDQSDVRRIDIIADLANCYQLRYASESDSADLDDALVLYQQAKSTDAEASLIKAVIDPGYGRALLQRFELSRDPSDLSVAIATLRASVSQAQAETPQLAEGLRSLGSALIASGVEADVNEGIGVLSRSISLAPAESPLRAERLLLLGRAMVSKSESTNDQELEEQGLATIESAMVFAEEVAPDVALAAAAEISLRASRKNDANRVARASRIGLNTVGRLLSTQLLRQHKEAWLRHAITLPALGACADARLGRTDTAAVTLERGRLLLLSEVLEADLSGIRRLEQFDEELYTRYRNAADALRAVERTDLAPKSSLPMIEREAHARRVRTGFSVIVERIRKVEGFENFLSAPTLEDLRESLAGDPLVYLATSEQTGVALIVDPGTETAPRAIWLDHLTIAAVQRAVSAQLAAYQKRRETPQGWRRELNTLTRWLWDAAVEPILASLPDTHRIILTPTGVLGLLPFHAAWAPGPNGSRCYALDRSAITYTPSAGILGSARQRTEPESIQGILGVYSNALPTAHVEIEQAIGWFKEAKVIEATSKARDGILQQLATWPTLHFACHSKADPVTPLEGGLRLDRDAQISVRDLLVSDILSSQMVVLSACETGVPGKELPDEAISLPTALMQAGAVSVISSMWAVPDIGSLLVTARFYELWRGNGLRPWEALRQAQRWVRDSTNEEKSRRFPTVDNLQGRNVSNDVRDIWLLGHDHADPYHWAAFAYVGA